MNSATQIEPGIYRHYKGKLYEVVGLARHSENLEILVVYKALYHSPDFGTDALWVRPFGMFTEELEPGVPRFRYLGKEKDI